MMIGKQRSSTFQLVQADESESMAQDIDMDVAVIACHRDLHLLKIMLVSFFIFSKIKGDLIIFYDENDLDEIRTMRLPEKHKLISKQSLGINGDDFRRQMFIKINIDLYTNKEYIWVVDCDYLLVDYIQEHDFFSGNRPIWLMRAWDNQPSLRWRKPTADMIGFDPPYQYMDRAQYIFSRKILQDIRSRISTDFFLRAVVPPSEFIAYGALSHRHFNQTYDWRFVDDYAHSLSYEITQRPPTYAELDSSINLDAAGCSKYCVFWSFWNLSEIKMIEFLKDACARRNVAYAYVRDFIAIERIASRDRLINRLCLELEEVKADRSAKDEIIERLVDERALIDQDRSAKSNLITKLILDIKEINQDREKRLEIIEILNSRSGG